MVHPYPTQQANTMPNQQPTQQASTTPNEQPTQRASTVQQPTQQANSNPILVIDAYGWSAVPLDRASVPSAQTARPPPSSVNFFYPPTALVNRAIKRTETTFPLAVRNHNLRVYHYAFAIVTTHFPDWIAGALQTPFLETLVLACLYHDIATVDNVRATLKMSLEWLGGSIALADLLAYGAPRVQAECVCEAIIRHRCLGKKGSMSRIGQLLQLATELGACGKSYSQTFTN